MNFFSITVKHLLIFIDCNLCPTEDEYEVYDGKSILKSLVRPSFYGKSNFDVYTFGITFMSIDDMPLSSVAKTTKSCDLVPTCFCSFCRNISLLSSSDAGIFARISSFQPLPLSSAVPSGLRRYAQSGTKPIAGSVRTRSKAHLSQFFVTCGN